MAVVGMGEVCKLGSHSNRSSGATWGGITKQWFKPGGRRSLDPIGISRDWVFLNIFRCCTGSG